MLGVLRKIRWEIPQPGWIENNHKAEKSKIGGVSFGLVWFTQRSSLSHTPTRVITHLHTLYWENFITKHQHNQKEKSK